MAPSERQVGSWSRPERERVPYIGARNLPVDEKGLRFNRVELGSHLPHLKRREAP